MPFDSLRAFVDALRRAGELHAISAPTDPYLEIAEITDRVVKAGGPALLFEHVKGSKFPVLTNQFGSQRRMALALDASTLDEAANRLRALLDLTPPGSSLGDKLGTLKRFAPLANAIPKTVRDAPCQEVVIREPDLRKLPVLTTWPLDGGPFITLPLVITNDPRTHRPNVGMYRMHVYNERETGMHWQRHKQGRAHAHAWGDKIPVAVAIGADPVLTYAATAPLPPVLDEFAFAGLLARQADGAGQGAHDRPQGSRACRVRARRLRRQHRPAHRRAVRRSHRRLQLGRHLSDVSRHVYHASPQSDLRRDGRRQTADGRCVARQGDRTALSCRCCRWCCPKWST